MKLSKIISGGQTGVDRAALDVALELGIPCGGWCPKGRLAEDGAIDVRYPLQETPSEEYVQRTEWNVRDSDGTLILSWGKPTGGTAFTIACAKKLHKPCLIFDLQKKVNRKRFTTWLQHHHIQILNIAGPRESNAIGRIFKAASRVLLELILG
ncbi:MAG: putative molybdenum carrier protein [Deltaproteobacteria bacterium]|nr:putative molybdenum carrier protein [Deltaproteobacteria bacterium]